MPDIDFQKIELNLIPKKGDEPVIFYASQYETARPFIAELMWGETEFAPGVDCYAEIDIRKNDDNLVVITDDVSIDNNEVSVVLPVQALTCIGKNLGQVKIYAADDQLIASLNFILEVQADPLAGGVSSETAIDNLTQQIEDIAQEVIGEDYYNKTETDALLADKADKSELPDMNDYYTKSQIDNTLTNNYATYTYLGIHYYNKASTENLIDDAVTLRGEAEGAVATFNTSLTVVPDVLNFYFDVPGGISSLNAMNVSDTDLAGALKNVYEGKWGFVDLGSLDYIYSDSGFSTQLPNDAKELSSNAEVLNCLSDMYEVMSWNDATYNKQSGTMGTGVLRYIVLYNSAYSDAIAFKAAMSGKYLLYELATESTPTITGTDFDNIVASFNANGEVVNIDLEGTYTEGYVDPINGVLHDTSVTPPVEHDITRHWIYQKEGINNIFSDGNDKTYVKYKDTIQHYIDTRL